MTTDPQRLAKAARFIADARVARSPLPVLPAEFRPESERCAYAVQVLVHQHLAEAGMGLLAGYKIGCTTPVMQHYLGIPNPCAGGIVSTGVHASGWVVDGARFCRIGIECEIGLRVGRTLEPSDAPFTAESVASSVDACMAAVEIVDDRYVDWRTTGTPTLIADDFFGAGCVLGASVPAKNAPDLAGLIGEVLINGASAGTGSGADVMGHPYRALAWLANNLADRGRRLEAGAVVLSGSVVQTRWLSPGDRVTVSLAGLGSVELVNR
ncbi:MAG: fumarylacetoacetate hydrolase family protein [Methylobacteriaceae bacterium]|nr:fumarylacetoacetate hydrolase family protein [Methylobacteriaceae bacterium]